LTDLSKNLRTLDMSMDIYAQVKKVDEKFEEQNNFFQNQID